MTDDIYRSWGLNTPGGIIERFIRMNDEGGSFAKVVAVVPFSDNPVARAAMVPDDARVDAFGRARFSSPHTLFDSKQIHDNLPLIFDDQQFMGADTGSDYDTNRASTLMTVLGGVAGIRIRKQKTYNNYQPGKSQLAILTAILGQRVDGILSQVGLFDEHNGLFFQLVNGILSVVIRSNVTGIPIDTIFTQDQWNVDKLDGTGKSSVTLNTAFAQIFFIDYEWLGSGRVRFGMFIKGIPLYVHEVNHANSAAAVYMSRPNLPVAYLIANDGSGPDATLEAICATVISEGGQQGNGRLYGVSRGDSDFNTPAMAGVFPLISIRLKADELDMTVNIINFSVVVVGNSRFEAFLLLNPDIVGGDNAVWTDLDNTAIQIDISRTNAVTLENGTDLGGIMADGKIETVDEMLLRGNALRLGSDILGDRDEIVLAIRMLPAKNESVYARLDIEELS